MLSFNIRDLEQQAAQVDGDMPRDDALWQEGDPLPIGAVKAMGRLSKAGAGRFYWSGHIEGTARVDCRRCLGTAEVTIEDDVHFIFAEANDEDADDPDVFHLPARAQSVDLRPAIREHWVLSVPSFALCREECKGLCPRCGADLNDGPCDCAPEIDGRWESLRTIRRASK
ncbi:MAG TPA: DUF177 domain-containing protein [Gemmatimonadaceae bacterium]|nr:DUF177 domain-containing protein [Gemmatimonadaceae bacterium]